MGRKKEELTEIRKEYVKKALDTVKEENGIKSDKALAEKIFYDPTQLSRVKNGVRSMPVDMATAIANTFPDKNYPVDWLRGLTPYRNEEERIQAYWEDNIVRISSDMIFDSRMIDSTIALLSAGGLTVKRVDPLQLDIDGHIVLMEEFRHFIKKTIRRTVLECSYFVQDYEHERSIRKYWKDQLDSLVMSELQSQQ